MNFPIALFNRPNPNKFLAALSPFMAVFLTLIIGGLIFAFMGKDPFYSMYVVCIEPLQTYSLRLRSTGLLSSKRLEYRRRRSAYRGGISRRCGGPSSRT